jgi:hypothetical protein
MILSEGVGEVGAAGRESVEVRRPDAAVSVGPDGIPSLLVGHDEQDVRFPSGGRFLRFRVSGGKERGKQKRGGGSHRARL